MDELLDPSPKVQIKRLNALQEKVNGGTDETAVEALFVVFSTHSSYQEHASREAASKVIVAASIRSIEARGTLAKHAATLGTPAKSNPISDIMTVLEWVNSVIKAIEKFDTTVDTSLIAVQGELLTKLLLNPEISSRHHFGRLVTSAVRNTRTSLAEAKDKKGYFTILVSSILGNTSSTSLSGLVLYSQFAGSCINKMVEFPEGQELVRSEIKKFYQAYASTVLGSKIPLTKEYICSGLAPIFNDYTTKEDFATDILPAVLKSLLRAPETVLVNIIPGLISNLSPVIDLGEGSETSNKLFDTLVNLLTSSSNAVVRSESYKTAEILVQHCYSQEGINKIGTKAISSLKTARDSEHRQSLALLLTRSREPISSALVDQLSALIAKESNEQALRDEIGALFHNTNDEKVLVDATSKGLAPAKPINIRKVWIEELSKVTKLTPKLTENVEPLLQKVFGDITANINISIQNKTIGIAIACIVMASKYDWTLDPASTAEILSSPRVYHKITLDDDFLLLIEALSNASQKSVSQYVDPWIYLLTSPSVPFTHRRKALEAFGRVSIEEGAFIDKLEQLSVSDDSNVISGPVLSALVESSTNKDMALVKLLVLTHQPTINIKGGWIGLCLRFQSDPARLVSTYSYDVVKHLIRNEDTEINRKLLPGVAGALATVAFVDPSFGGQTLSDIYNQCKEFPRSISKRDLVIFNTPENELATELDDIDEENTLKQKKAVVVENKNSKDYETLKWEESVKEGLLAKKKQQQAANGSAKKAFTKEEQQQLQEQAEVRSRVKCSQYIVTRILYVTEALSRQTVDDGAAKWSLSAVEGLLEIGLDSNALAVIGEQAWAHAFMALSNRLSPRIDHSIKTAISLSIIRTHITDSIEKVVGVEHLQEPLEDLVLRVLYRIKFLSDQQSLDDVISLAYLLPLLLKVITEGMKPKSKKKQVEVSKDGEVSDPKDEQTILVLEILNNHAQQFVRIPSETRRRVLSDLITVMITNLPLAKLAGECLMGLVQSAAVEITMEELQVLLDEGVLCGNEEFVRTTVLQAIDAELDLSTYSENSGHTCKEIWIEKFDADSEVCSGLADDIWQESKFEVVENLPLELVDMLGTGSEPLRGNTARAIAASTAVLPDQFVPTFQKLVELFEHKSKPPMPVYDRFGILVKSVDQDDSWQFRSGIALAWRELAAQFDSASVLELFKFLVQLAGTSTISAGLGDENKQVSQEVLQAGIEVVKHAKNIEDLIPIFETYLSENKGSSDNRSVSEAIIILYGAVAQHLPPGDTRLFQIVDRLLDTLDVPNEDVQYAIAEGIVAFKPQLGSSAELGEYIKKLMAKLLDSNNPMAVRKGAAYGIAGFVKCSGISALSDYDITRELIEAVEDRKDPHHRESAQFAFECLSLLLKNYFEPYALELIPFVLSCLGDGSGEVRTATSYTAREFMKNTTAFGVSKLIPIALDSLNNQTSWRAKKGALDLLGSMAYLDPQQLSASLSIIVPEIVAVLNDSHKEVRNSANQALAKFGDVIKNPEIQKLVPLLIKAISDPPRYTSDALLGLLKTRFVHYIDGPSLALLVHVINRGLKDRSAEVKKRACQIVGNMAILTDSRDLVPYLPSMVADLQVAMVDPVPGTRAMASKALGSLVEKLGEERFPTLIPQLMDALADQNRPGDRLGSAQALSEVIYGLGLSKLDELLPKILENCTSPKPWVRQGFMPLLLFFPACFGNTLGPYLGRIIPVVLFGLADTVDEVREISLQTGRGIVRNYASRAVDLLLPELEKGLVDESYRIRFASVELVGDLLFQITGISSTKSQGGDDEDEEDEDTVTALGTTAFGTSKALIDTLGLERRDRVLSLLFMCRSDTYGQVRTTALEVWKSLVVNTPRTIKEILPTLTQMIIKRLASPVDEHRTIAAHTLGELVRRVGGNALAQILPQLDRSMNGSIDNEGGAPADMAAVRQGICIALVELVDSNSVSSHIDDEYKNTIVRIVKQALVDSDPRVREAAGQAFEALQTRMGGSEAASDTILPDLIDRMQQGDEAALSALMEMLATNSEQVLPPLLSSLLQKPMTAFKANCIGQLPAAAGAHKLVKRISSILDALIAYELELRQQNGDEQELLDIDEAIDEVICGVIADSSDTEGERLLMLYLLENSQKAVDADRRAIVFTHLTSLFSPPSGQERSLVLQQHKFRPNTLADWVQVLIAALEERNEVVLKPAWTALASIVKSLSKPELEALVIPAKQALEQTGGDADYDVNDGIPGLSLPRGPSCILPIFVQGLMFGTGNHREVAAIAVADLVKRTPSEQLKPFVTQITGPLIRTIGERFSPDVKAAILQALNVLLNRIPGFLRPFLPQLQRTFAKSLSDTSSQVVRDRAAKALGSLITLQTRVDPLVNELLDGVKNPASERGVKLAMIQALVEISTKANNNLSEQSRNQIFEYVAEEVTVKFDATDNAYTGKVELGQKDLVLAATLVSGLTAVLDVTQVTELAKSVLDILENPLSSEQGRVYGLLVLNGMLKYGFERIDEDANLGETVARVLAKNALSHNADIRENSILGLGKYLLKCKLTQGTNDEDTVLDTIVDVLATTIVKSDSTTYDARRLSLTVLRLVSIKRRGELVDTTEALDKLVKPLFGCVRDTIIAVKLAAEKAYLELFDLIDSGSDLKFTQWIEHAESTKIFTSPNEQRSITEYTRRVALKIAAKERERREAGGDEETVHSDIIEDEFEIYSVGRMEL